MSRSHIHERRTANQLAEAELTRLRGQIERISIRELPTTSSLTTLTDRTRSTQPKLASATGANGAGTTALVITIRYHPNERTSTVTHAAHPDPGASPTRTLEGSALWLLDRIDARQFPDAGNPYDAFNVRR